MDRKDLEGASTGLHLPKVTDTEQEIQSFRSDYVLKLLLLFATDPHYIVSPVCYLLVTTTFLSICSIHSAICTPQR